MRARPPHDVAAGFHSQRPGEGRPPSQRTAALRHPPASVPLRARGICLSCQYVGRASALRSLVNVEGLPREACAGLGAWPWSPVPCRVRGGAGPSLSPRGRLSLRLLALRRTQVHTGESRAGLCLSCCCIRRRLVSSWVSGSLPWGWLGSTRWRVFPILTGPLSSPFLCATATAVSQTPGCLL